MYSQARLAHAITQPNWHIVRSWHHCLHARTSNLKWLCLHACLSLHFSAVSFGSLTSINNSVVKMTLTSPFSLYHIHLIYQNVRLAVRSNFMHYAFPKCHFTKFQTISSIVVMARGHLYISHSLSLCNSQTFINSIKPSPIYHTLPHSFFYSCFYFFIQRILSTTSEICYRIVPVAPYQFDGRTSVLFDSPNQYIESRLIIEDINKALNYMFCNHTQN